MEELLQFVQKVKTALKDEVIKRSYIEFHDFPEGACMDASTLLGVLLDKNGFGLYQLVSASNERGKWFSHTWLENDKYLIDITANQFNSWPEQPLAISLAEKPSHYQSLTIQFRGPVLQHNNVPDPGFYMAMNMVTKTVRA